MVRGLAATTHAERVFGILAAAFLLGVAGDVLLRPMPWGLGVSAWTLALLASAVALSRGLQVPLKRDALALAVPTFLFAALVAWRDSTLLTGLNLATSWSSLALAAWWGRSERLHVAGILEHALAGLSAGLYAYSGLLHPLGILKARDLTAHPLLRVAARGGLGVVIAAPLLLLFGSLFSSADPIFQRTVASLIQLDAWDFVLVCSLAWLAAGLLFTLFLREPDGAAPNGAGAQTGRLGAVEMGIVLGSLNLLFLGFVAVQVRYFFGGAEIVEATIRLTYAEYAREGFFQLLAVSALTLPLLLIMHSLVPPDARHQLRLYVCLALGLVAMLSVIMLSAIQRMLLYQEVFGLTELRVYTTACMAWLALVFVWFSVTVLRGRRRYFAVGALAAGYAVVLGLNVVSPDALIAEVNLQRLAAGQPRFDSSYLASLGADSVPALVAGLDLIGEPDRGQVWRRILIRWGEPEPTDWRVWNAGRHAARKAVAERVVSLQQAVQAP